MNITIADKIIIPDIMNLISECITDMEAQGIYQWNNYYPSIEIIAKDVHGKSLYIMQNQKSCLGIISFDEKQEPEYEKVKWLSSDPRILVVHRLAVCPKCQRQGIGRKLMDFAEKFAIENEYVSIRLDAYSGNMRAIEFYEQRGYQKTGHVYFPMRKLPFYCYEKIL